MDRTVTRRLGIGFLHTVIWILGFLFVGDAITYPKAPADLALIANSWKWIDLVGTCFNVAIFYLVGIWLAPRFALTHRWSRFLGMLFVVWIVLGSLEFAVDSILLSGYPKQYLFSFYVPALLLKLILFSVFALTHRFILDRYMNQQLIKEQRQQQLEAELKFLKAQISPHFLFNTLNNIYGEALDTGAEYIAEKIARLSGLMRYMLYETDAGEVSLQQEIDCIEGLIALNALRADEGDKLEVDFKVEGAVAGYYVVPMILIPFVENALKHGYRMYEYSPIAISINTVGEGLVFETRNRLFEKLNDMEGQSGLGLNNIRKRLDLIYGNRYKLEIKEESGYFSVWLQINRSKHEVHRD